MVRILVLLAFFSCWIRLSFAQKPDSLAEPVSPLRTEIKSDRISFLLYVRIISDAKGNVRFDENIVPNFKLNKWLRLEAGFRQGERPQRLDSYYQYKIELQTKYFKNSFRFFARLSDNVIKYPSPNYVKSNYLVVAEGKHRLSRSWMATAGVGYVFSSQTDNSSDALPAVNGVRSNYPTYKIGLRYLLREKGFLEASYGAYDVFNPYLLSSPFFQTTFEYEISRRTTLYSYFRYQFDEYVDMPLNDFVGIGVRLHLL